MYYLSKTITDYHKHKIIYLNYDKRSVTILNLHIVDFYELKERRGSAFQKLQNETYLSYLLIAFICKLTEIIKMLLQHHKKFHLMNHCNDANGVKLTAAQFYSPSTESLKAGLPDFQLLQMI